MNIILFVILSMAMPQEASGSRGCFFLIKKRTKTIGSTFQSSFTDKRPSQF